MLSMSSACRQEPFQLQRSCTGLLSDSRAASLQKAARVLYHLNGKAAHQRIGSIAAPWQGGRHEADVGNALRVRAMRSIKGHAPHAEVMLLQQAQQPLLAGACALRPCSRRMFSLRLEKISRRISPQNMTGTQLALR